MRKQINCANCGGIGHIYKNCSQPVASYGVICFNSSFKYLLIQRKDSMSYVEFIRGKYVIEHRRYIYKLLSQMTVAERDCIKDNDFDTLWRDLWQISDCNSFVREYTEAKIKFDKLRNGFYISQSQSQSQSHTTHNQTEPVIFFDLEIALLKTKSELKEPEWGFPKGRRNINEDDFDCATREFNEETAIDLSHLRFLQPTKPYDEVFIGSNKVRYKHVYYLAEYTPPASHSPSQTLNHMQLREIKAMRWMSYNEALEKISADNIERKELFKRAHVIIMNSQSLEKT